MTETELIRGLRTADEAAFKELVNRFQDSVYNTSLGLIQNTADAEDIAQEVFIQVYKSIHQFKEAAQLSTWIYRITTTKSLDFLRSKRRKKRFGFIKSLFGEDRALVVDPEDFNHPGILQERKEEAAQLFTLINQLPGNQRAAFILNKVEELSYKEIAAIMQTTEASVDALLQRAKKQLQKKIAEMPG